MPTTETMQPVPITRRKLIVRDTLSFLSLIALTLVLLAVTLFLFRSFMSHRADLARSWSEQGHAALLAHQPETAVACYRAALSYAPGEHTTEVMLAQALAEAGHTEEAYNYYMELWGTHPGDGATNLQLARLAAKKREVQQAINFYRASLYGTWEGDGVERRRAVRLELAAYLILQRQFESARAELLIAGGNAPDTTTNDLALARLLEQAGAPADALAFYRQALAGAPNNLAAARSAGRISFDLRQYDAARSFLAHANHLQADTADEALLAQAQRIGELEPAETLPTRERVARILELESIVRKHLAACATQTDTSGALPPSSRRTHPGLDVGRAALLRSAETQSTTIQLVYDTEEQAIASCGKPTGEDAVVLLLAQAARAQTKP